MSFSDTVNGIFKEYDEHKQDISDLIDFADDIGLLNRDSVEKEVNQTVNTVSKQFAPNIIKEYLPYIIGITLVGGILIYMAVKK